MKFLWNSRAQRTQGAETALGRTQAQTLRSLFPIFSAKLLAIETPSLGSYCDTSQKQSCKGSLKDGFV